MDKQIIKLNKSFEEAVYEQNGVEYWLARDLQILLEYDEWRNFSRVIDKAKISCQNAGQNPADHFVDVNKMIKYPGKSIDNLKKYNDIDSNITPSASAAGAGPSFGVAFAFCRG